MDSRRNARLRYRVVSFLKSCFKERATPIRKNVYNWNSHQIKVMKTDDIKRKCFMEVGIKGLCLTKKQQNFIYNRGTNGREWF